MCKICDGFSLDEVMADYSDRIAEHGFVLVGVEGPRVDGVDRPPAWAYTVGLLDAADHPELVIAGGVSAELMGSLLSFLARSVLEGERYDVDDEIVLAHGSARVGAVHEIQHELGTFNVWDNLRRIGTLQTQELEAVQIVLPSNLFCSVHRFVQPLLDDPHARVDAPRPRPNRAERRRHRHGYGRSA